MSPSTPSTIPPAGRLRRRWAALLLCAAGLLGVSAPSAQTGDYAQSPVVLTHTYLGGDDSVLSLRAVGSQVVGVSHAVDGSRVFLFNGTRSGDLINGQVTMLPRGGQTDGGSLTLRLSSGGSVLERDSGMWTGTRSWVARLPSHFQFPQGGEARFQSTSSADMDGAYRGSDGSRIWVRQMQNGQVFWYAERFATADATRPVFASVGIATRGAQNQLNGQFWDLPHQTGPLLSGYTVGARLAANRDFAQTMMPLPAGPSPRGAAYKADYAIDLERFEQELHTRLAPFFVGYGYAISTDGVVRRTGAGGARRTPTAENGLLFPLAFTTGTMGDIASTSKTVTAAAVLKKLRAKGVSVDAPILPYLPWGWTKGPGMETATFRQMLSHGYKPAGSNRLGRGAANCQTDFYGCLRDAVGVGMTEPADYDNIHYTLMRYVLPILDNPVGWQLWIANQVSTTTINEGLSAAFRDQIRAMLAGVGVDADFQYVYGAGENGAYRYVWGPPPSGEIVPSPADTATDYLKAGSGSLKMKPSEYARFLSRLERGDILGAADMTTLRDVNYGGDQVSEVISGQDGIGRLWTKNGGATGVAAQLMVYPGAEAFILMNSSDHPASPGLASLLRDAWQAALVTAP
jgi:hypothetical protein